MNVIPNQESIQNRLNQIRLAQSNSNPQIPSIDEINANQNNFNSSSSLNIGNSLSSSSKSFQETLQSELNSKSISKEKFGTFVQQANEMFQNYEKEINSLRKRISFYDTQELSYNIINAFSIEPSKKQKVLHELSKLTEKEKISYKEIKIAYTERICELLTENDALTKMIEKINVDVVDRLQEKISELGRNLRSQEFDNSNLRRQLENMESVFDQNQALKEDISMKSKEITKLRIIKESNEKTINELTSEINVININMENANSSLESKNKTIEQKIIEINSLNDTLTKRNESIIQKEEIIKKKEEEIKLLFNDNVKWEEKYALASKEIANYKKWSLWDMNLVDCYKKIDDLENTINNMTNDKTNLEEQINSLEKENSDKTNQILTLTSNINNIEKENFDLKQIKVQYEHNKNKIDNYDKIFQNNNQLKSELHIINNKYTKEIESIKESYEKTIKDQKLKYSSEISEQKIDYELKLDKAEKSKVSLIEEYEMKIHSLQDEIKKIKNQTEELNAQIEKKSIALTNYKESYDNLMLKLKEQEKQLMSKESAQQEEPLVLLNNESSQSKDNNSTGDKIISTFDKYAFTKEMMIDYFYCLYLFEESIHYQSILNNMLGNIDNYFNNIFICNKNSFYLNTSLQSECLQDLYFIAVKKLILADLIKSVDEINFETFTREVLREISICYKTKNFISKLTSSKTIDKLSALFLRKYTKNFDFEGSLKDFLTNNVLPSIENRIEKKTRVVNDDTLKLIEMTLNTIKNGHVYINNKSVYSFDKFLQQHKNFKINDNSVVITNKIICFDYIIHIFKYEQIDEVILKENSLSENEFTFIFDMILLHIPKLTSLKIISNNLNGNIFTTKFISFLKLLKNINYLDLTDNKITDEDIKPFSEFLKTNKSIKTLLLDNNKMTSTAGFFVADALNKNICLQKLSLNVNEIVGSGLESLLNVISNNNHGLNHLCLGDNKFQNVDFVQIANFFSSNPPLRVLDLSNNTINCASADILGADLKKAKQLKCLILNNTKLNDESAPQVLNSIHETNIEEIELDMNIFTESGPFVIMNKIRKAVNVKKLSLKRCGMTPQFLNIIAANIMDNQNLKEINLEGNDFEEEVFVKFCEDIKANKITKIIFTKDLLLGNVKDVLNENIILM